MNIYNFSVIISAFQTFKTFLLRKQDYENLLIHINDVGGGGKKDSYLCNGHFYHL